MALKSKITDKAEFDKLSDVLKAEYKEEGGVWLLQSDEATELRAAKDREVQARKDAETERDKLKQEKADAEAARVKAEQDAAEAAARKSGDITTLEKSWQKKYDDALAIEKARGDRLEGLLRNAVIDGRAESLAAEISLVPELLAPVIAKRLSPDFTGDKAIVRVLDANGQPSAANFDDLKKELLENKSYASIIRGSNGSGSGASGGGSGGGAAGKKISDMTEKERVELHRANPALYREQAAREGLTVN